MFLTEITTHPSSTTVIALQDVTLTCSASVDDVTYSWHRDGGSVPRGQNSNTLTITRATPPDEGRYYCMASKEGISVESNRATVRVDGEKNIIVYTIDHNVQIQYFCLQKFYRICMILRKCHYIHMFMPLQ